MHRMSRLILLLTIMAVVPAHANPAATARLRESYQLALDKWALEMRMANTPADRAKAWANRPRGS